jgi:hypothetical protein
MPFTIPVTMPVDAPAVAIAVLLLLHVPLAVASVSVIVPPPPHTVVGPEIAAGRGFAVSVRVISQPVVVSLYVIVVAPVAMPETMPEEEPMVAIDVLPLLHVPLVVASVKVTVEPRHTPIGPAMAAGSGFTVTTVVAMHDVGSV